MLLTIPRFIILFLSPFTSLSKVIKIRNSFWIKSFLRKILRCFSVCHRITSQFPSQFHFTVLFHSTLSQRFPRVSIFQGSFQAARLLARGGLHSGGRGRLWRPHLAPFRVSRSNKQGMLKAPWGIWVAQDDRHLDFFGSVILSWFFFNDVRSVSISAGRKFQSWKRESCEGSDFGKVLPLVPFTGDRQP